MRDCCSPKGYRWIFSENRAHAEARRYRRRGLDASSRRIAELLKKQGVAGRTLLEVGGGVGAMQIELLKAGVTRAVSIELTPTYEEAARELLREAGLEDRIERTVMDFAETAADVEAADILIMNRVICCYPDMPQLNQNTQCIVRGGFAGPGMDMRPTLLIVAAVAIAIGAGFASLAGSAGAAIARRT